MGHFFSVEVSGGKVVFIDAQVGDVDVRLYFDGLEPSSIIYGRLDRLSPSYDVINAVKTREEVQP
jgi:hypothetical protein